MNEDLKELTAAAKLVARLTSSTPLESSYLLDDMTGSIRDLVAKAEPLVAEETGFAAPFPAVPLVLKRSEWAAANVESMLVLMRPLIDGMERRIRVAPGSSLFKMAYRPALGAQLGTVLGLLSQRVLGQYDVLMGHKGEVWFVGVNLLMMERRLGLVPSDFRLWVAIHELTHRAQFEGNGWVRDHFLAKADGLVESLDIDARSLLTRAIRALSSPGSDPLAVRLMSERQRQLFMELQAFMTVIEGHGNFVMDRVAARVIPTHERMRTAFRGSTQTGVAHKLITKILGLELKKAQYEQGQRFFEAVHAAAGQSAVAAVFRSPEDLPSMDEIRAPESWIRRVIPNSA